MDIGLKEYSIYDRFTLIHGKIEMSDVSAYANTAIKTCLKHLNCISIENFIDMFDAKKTDYTNLKKVLDLPHYLVVYNQKSKLNSDIIIQLYSLSQEFKNLVELNYLLTKKQELLRELETSNIYEKESAISTITELIDDLEENIKVNQKKLTYFEEDYLKRKNQIDSIKNNISDFSIQISRLNEEKKAFFSKINKITRQMEEKIEKKTEMDNNGKKDDKLSNSEKIKRFQINAREIQHQINQLRSKIEVKKAEIAKFEPQFKVLEKDHNKIISLIQNDKNRIKELKEKLKNEIQDSIPPSDVDNQQIKEIKVRSKKEIETEITQIERKLTQIEIPKKYYNPKNPRDFSKIQSKILEITNKVKDKKDQMQIATPEKEISQIIQKFELLEDLIKEIESLVNLFLKEINLESQFLITFDKDEENLFIEIIFTRNEKEQMKFENLTTPEKVFFAIIFYLCIEMLNNSTYIIFSNLHIPDIFNKRGSTERTIKKILPLFNKEPRLLDISLIFIIANLDIKSDINNLKLIEIKES